jgi:hypothetical protein
MPASLISATTQYSMPRIKIIKKTNSARERRRRHRSYCIAEQVREHSHVPQAGLRHCPGVSGVLYRWGVPPPRVGAKSLRRVSVRHRHSLSLRVFPILLSVGEFVKREAKIRIRIRTRLACSQHSCICAFFASDASSRSPPDPISPAPSASAADMKLNMITATKNLHSGGRRISPFSLSSALMHYPPEPMPMLLRRRSPSDERGDS